MIDFYNLFLRLPQSFSLNKQQDETG